MRNGSYFPGRGTLVEETFRKGYEEGFRKGRVRVMSRVLELRGIPVSEAQHALITACTGDDQFDRWSRRALTATSADDLFVGDLTTEDAAGVDPKG